MTDDIKGIVVTLERGISKDDAKFIIDAIKMIKGVISVEDHIADYEHYFAVELAKQEMIKKMWDILK